MKSQSTMKYMMICFLAAIVFVSLFSLSNSKLREIKQKNPSNLNSDELVSQESSPILRINKLKVENSKGKELKKPKNNKHKLVYSLESDAEDPFKDKKPNHTIHENKHHKANHTDHLSTDKHEKSHHKDNHTHTAIHLNHTVHSNHPDHTHHSNPTENTHHANHAEHSHHANHTENTHHANNAQHSHHANNTVHHNTDHVKNSHDTQNKDSIHHSGHHNQTSHIPTPPNIEKYGKGSNTEKGKPTQHEQTHSTHPKENKPNHSSSNGAVVGTAAAVSTAGLLSTQIQAADEEKSIHQKSTPSPKNNNSNSNQVSKQNNEKSTSPVKSTTLSSKSATSSSSSASGQSSNSQNQSTVVAYSGPSSSPPEDVQYEPVEYVSEISPQGRAAILNTKE